MGYYYSYCKETEDIPACHSCDNLWDQNALLNLNAFVVNHCDLAHRTGWVHSSKLNALLGPSILDKSERRIYVFNLSEFSFFPHQQCWS